MMMLSYH